MFKIKKKYGQPKDTLARIRLFATGIILCLPLISMQASVAGTIEGEINFRYVVPYTGLIYFYDESNEHIESIEIQQKDREFNQKIFVAHPGSTIKFRNSDEISQNVFANSPENNVTFDLGLIKPGDSTEINVDWEPYSVIRIGSRVNPKARAYIANIPGEMYSPLDLGPRVKNYAVTMNIYNREILSFGIWLPKYDPVKITLKPGEKITFPLMKNGSKHGEIVARWND